jgi:outer membrane autotransporter protein
MESTGRVIEMLTSRLSTAGAGDSTGLSFSRLAVGRVTRDEAQRELMPVNGMWARSFTNGGDTDIGDDSQGDDWRSAHTAMGFDASIGPDTVVGATATYTRDTVELSGKKTRASRIRSPQLMVYARHTTESAQLRGVTGCAQHQYDTERHVSVGSATSLAHASHGATECSAYGEVEFDNIRSLPRLSPVLGVQYSRLDESSYVETGGVASLSVMSRSIDSIKSNAGVRFTQQFNEGRGTFEARAMWSHEYGERNPALRASLAGAESRETFVVRGTGQERDTAVIGAGITSPVGRSSLYFIDYNLELAGGEGARHAFIAGFRYVH